MGKRSTYVEIGTAYKEVPIKGGIVMKLGKDGLLWKRRGGEWKKQFCPVISSSSGGAALQCGDWCPQMSEPYGGQIDICMGQILYSNQFTDERNPDERMVG